MNVCAYIIVSHNPGAGPSPLEPRGVCSPGGIIRLEGQARALGGLVAAHTSSTQLRSYASQLGDDTTDSQHMSGMMQKWHQALPSPYQPGTGMGPGMISGHNWAGMQHQYGHEFNGHWRHTPPRSPAAWRAFSPV